MRTDDLNEAVKVLQAGLPLVFPTDTVVGMGVAVCAAEDTQALSAIKGRDASKPIAWLVDSEEALSVYGCDVASYAYNIARKFWPGGLTLIVKASEAVPAGFRSNGTIGLRAPNDRVVLQLIESVGCPIATTSANIAGKPAPTVLSEVDPALLQQVDSFSGSQLTSMGVEDMAGEATNIRRSSSSTVIDCTSSRPQLLREGTILYSDILSSIDAQ